MSIFNRQSGFLRVTSRGSNRPYFIPAFILFLMITAAFVAAASIHSGVWQEEAKTENEVSASVESKTLSPTPAPSPPPQTAPSVELITITPRGFEPNRIRRPAGGRVMLVVVNRSELPTMTLRLLGGSSAVIGEAQVPRNRRRWTVPPANLPAGRYRIIDVSRPNFVCDIEITP